MIRDEELQKLLNIADVNKRRLYFVGLVSEFLEGIKPVIVGGCALEFYSLGGYATGDVDVVYPDGEKLDAILLPAGFKREGRFWVNDDLGILFEAPTAFLPENEKDRVIEVSIEGLTVQIIGVEDLILDRLNAAVHWKSTDDLGWASELVTLYRDNLDVDYLTERASIEKTAEALMGLLRDSS